MNIRRAIIACVGVTAFGQLGVACGGQVGATGAAASSTNDAGAVDSTSASSTGGSGSGSSGAGSTSRSGGSGGASSSGGSSGTPSSSGGGSGSSASSSGSGSGSSSSSGATSGSGSGSGNSSEGGASDSGADAVAGDALGGLDAAGDSGDGGGAIGYDSATGDGATGCGSPAVSFSADIMPIFQRGCTLSSVCHGQVVNNAEENLYLGLNGGGGGTADSQAVYSGLVGIASKEDPSMNLVTAGDISNSYLWHKVNDDQVTLNSGTLATGCLKASAMCVDCTTDAPCGGSMPYLGELLATYAPEDLCTIENWISQGAPNN